MLGGEACAPAPTPVARSLHNFAIRSDRQAARAAAWLNGDGSPPPDAESLVARAGSTRAVDRLPRDIVLELTTRRATRPIFWPGRYLDTRRLDMTLEIARRVIEQAAELDGTRLTLAGLGDPLLSPHALDIIAAASGAGLAVHVESDFCGVDAGVIRALAASAADVVSVHLHATSVETYQAVMGVDGYREALMNVQAFVMERATRRSLLPILAPLFFKCGENLAEMEAFYDQWLRAVGVAVLDGPSDFAGQIPDRGAVDMCPPRRRPCARIASRLTVLSDGRYVSCEQDVLGTAAAGSVWMNRLADIWAGPVARLRASHEQNDWALQPLCAGCRDWHRP